MILRITDEVNANKCDELLTELIRDEKQYDNFINEKFIVKDYFKNIIKDKKNILLGYQINNEIVGYIFLKFLSNEDSDGYLIDGLYVDIKYRNRGIAKSLLEEGLNIIKEKHVNFIDVNVMFKNKVALKLYEMFGFEFFSFKMRKNNF